MESINEEKLKCINDLTDIKDNINHIYEANKEVLLYTLIALICNTFLYFVNPLLSLYLLIPIIFTIGFSTFIYRKQIKYYKNEFKEINENCLKTFSDKNNHARHINYKGLFDACRTLDAVESTYNRYYNIPSKNYEELYTEYSRASRRTR